ncbi:MAG: hypothetical protein JRG94_21125 [Deltaproteobacteria bacterium]|nr:hypothetical protein [Deltaproteobacteria bacterium]
MLRASIEYLGGEGDLRAITEGAKAADSGVAHGEELTAFAEAAVRGDPAELATARDSLRDVAGSAALVDAAGVVGNFQRMVRIADGAGISLDTSVGMMSEDFREELGLDQFESAGRSKGLSALTRALAPVLRGAARLGLRTIGRRARNRAGA